MKKFLIIGSNSFSGSSFINYLLDKDHAVVGLSRSREKSEIFASYKHNKNFKRKYKFYKVDINKSKDLYKINKIINKFRPQIVVNYAAQGMVNESWKKPEDWYKTNIIAQTNLYKLLKKKFIKKIIHVTTPEVYGNNTSTLKETTRFNPSTPYAISRAALDWHLLENYKQFNLPVILTRTANVFGPTQDLYRIVPKTILNSLLKKKFILMELVTLL